MKTIFGRVYVFSHNVMHGLLKIDKTKFMCSSTCSYKTYLKKCGYTPGKRYKAVQTVLQKSEALSASWVA